MVKVRRFVENPILSPDDDVAWEAEAVFNGCPIKDGDKIHFVYRAVSSPFEYCGFKMKLSSIGYASSKDGINFEKRRKFIEPEYDWEKFGCEDPRVTKIGDRYFIFYTALSDYPPSPAGIKVGLAITRNFEKIDEKHQATFFNSKAMALFPEKIGGKLAAILTVNTDRPPSDICVAFFDNEPQIWSKAYWDKWASSIEKHSLPLRRNAGHQIEVGAPPIKTKYGWLIIYGSIRNYFSPRRIFGIEAVLLDLKDPMKMLGRTNEPIFVPEKYYERYGDVPDVIFPSGALLKNKELSVYHGSGIADWISTLDEKVKDKELLIYYGASDTVCCLAALDLEELVAEMLPKKEASKFMAPSAIGLERFEGNPIAAPIKEHSWESKYAFNPAAIYEGGRVHVLYRAMGDDETSVLGYTSSEDGLHFDERLAEPIYKPREDFEMKVRPGFSGCEDARLTKIGDEIYMCYTAFNAEAPPRVAFTSIKVDDFLNKRWNWKKPVLISPPGVHDKNACIFPEKIHGQYAFFHRMKNSIWIDFVDDLDFDGKTKWLGGDVLFSPREDKWDSLKIGIAGPPIKVNDEWLLIYHGLSAQDNKYRLGAAMLDLENPRIVTARLDYPILESDPRYNIQNSYRPGTVFACGSVVVRDRLFVYYGEGDQVTCAASVKLKALLDELYKIKMSM
jgi:predicted GH43/DUF377 family glycosyl hydrolase